VEIAGVLKSNLDSGAAARGHRIGNTTIVVGAQSATRDRAMRPVTEEVLPVLEVKSYEGAGMNCRR
jgi:hypothetical protein